MKTLKEQAAEVFEQLREADYDIINAPNIKKHLDDFWAADDAAERERFASEYLKAREAHPMSEKFEQYARQYQELQEQILFEDERSNK